MKKYENYTKEQLIQKIKQLESKKYGLVWDDEKEPEKVVIECQNNIPILKKIDEKTIKTDIQKPTNILIEGDNYHALQVLNYTHKGQIDVIYIDPPYNRGGDFIYNDLRIEKDDNYKHSKWLNFIEKRLNLAKNLLSNDGVMIISIDDAEYINLRFLCNKLFDEKNVDTMVWRKSGAGRDGKMKNTSTFRKDHEYLIFCFKNQLKLNKLKDKPNFQNTYKNLDNDPRGSYKAGSISRKEIASKKEHENYYTVVSPSGKKFTRQFDMSQEEFNKLNDDNRIYWGKKNDAVPAIKIFIDEERSITPYSILLNQGTTTDGTKEVSEILKKDCSQMRPKPTSLVSAIVQLASKNDSIILDFFAGTGTTGHSTLITNIKYGGNRRYILCTDNNENICTNYCYPRLSEINKNKFLHNLDYYKTDLIPTNGISNITDSTREDLTKKAGNMIAIKENTHCMIELCEHYQIFINEATKKQTAIYFTEDLSYFDELIEKTKSYFTKLYIFSFGKIDKSSYKYLGKNFSIEDIPEPIIEIYKEINKEGIL